MPIRIHVLILATLFSCKHLSKVLRIWDIFQCMFEVLTLVFLMKTLIRGSFSSISIYYSLIYHCGPSIKRLNEMHRLQSFSDLQLNMCFPKDQAVNVVVTNLVPCHTATNTYVSFSNYINACLYSVEHSAVFKSRFWIALLMSHLYVHMFT